MWWALWNTTALAAILEVGPGRRYPTPQAALAEASAGDTLRIDAGNYPGSLEVAIDLRLEAAPGARVSLTGGAPDLLVVEGARVELINLVLRPAQRGIRATDADLYLEGCTIEGARTDEEGAGMLAEDSAVQLSNCVFSNNDATPDDAGHLYLRGGALLAEGTTFEDGVGDDGGAIRTESASVELRDCQVLGNRSTEDGGALDIRGGSFLAVGSTFRDNVADASTCTGAEGATCEGGVVRFGDEATWAFDDCLFEDNTALADVGGAVSNRTGSSGSFQASVFRNNSGTFGGAVYLGSSGSVSLENCTFEANVATSTGGAIRWRPDAADPSLTLRDSLFLRNRATDDGGAVAIDTTNGSRGELIVESSWFEANESGLDGGAIQVRTLAATTLRETRFCANRAGNHGGGLDLDSLPGSVTLRDLTGIENQASAEGGFVRLLASSEVTFQDATLVGNRAAEGAAARLVDSSSTLVNLLAAFQGSGPVFSGSGGDYTLDYPLLWANDGPPGSGVGVGPGAVEADPLLAAYTPRDCTSDLSLAAGSPAIDAGDPTLADPDGSRSDIGAAGGSPTTPGADPPTDADGDGSFSDQDCDDADATIRPGAAETCDGVDQDCDGLVDEDAEDATEWWVDADLDGFGDPDRTVQACAAHSGLAANLDDCADNDASRFPGAPEVCDGRDQDCDGEVDEDVQNSFWWDADGDGFGDPDVVVSACQQPPGTTPPDGEPDCDDADPTVYPGAADLPGDDRDADCSGDDSQEREAPPEDCGCSTQGNPWLLGGIILAFLSRRRSPLQVFQQALDGDGAEPLSVNRL